MYPNVPDLFNLLMDPMEKMDPESKEWGYVGRQFFAQRMWTGNAAGPFLAAHLKSLADFPPRQKADTLSLKKALEGVMSKLENAKGSGN
jgi:arylsulfatase